MINIYDYFNKMIDINRLSHSFLIGNTTFEEIKNDLYKVINEYIFKDNVELDSNPDLYVIRSEKGVIAKDKIKSLISDISTTSQFNNNKVYIIDSCEYLNDYSYNAILKTLEEPKDNIYAFLITSNIDSIKDTIVSRCQKIFISSESNNKEFDEIIKNKAEELIDYIENDNIKAIGLHPNIYSMIESREELYDILNYMLYKYRDRILDEKDDNLVEKISKKLLVINNNMCNIHYNLNKNLIIDRLIVEMWRC